MNNITIFLSDIYDNNNNKQYLHKYSENICLYGRLDLDLSTNF